MTTTTNNSNNGASSEARSRKTLASQIDRLDGILDGLSEGLNQSVADAVKGAVEIAVREAVQAVMAELLTNADVLALVGATLKKAMPAEERPTLGQKMSSVKDTVAQGCQSMGQSCRQGVSRLWQWLGTQWQKVKEGTLKICQNTWLLHRMRVPLLVAVAVGTGTGTLAYVAGPWLGIAFSALGGFVSTASVQASLWLHQRLEGTGLLNG